MATRGILLARAFRKRPLLSASAAASAGILAAGAAVEYRAERLQRLNDPRAARLPRDYDWDQIYSYWMQRPLTTTARFLRILRELVPLGGEFLWDFVLRTPPSAAGDTACCPDPLAQLQAVHAARWREALTALGPAFVKGGQQVSIRPDLVPPPVLAELQRLCDAVRPVPDAIALGVLRGELLHSDTESLDDIFSDLQLVAAASIGQVYRAKVRKTGDLVAVKVQRPGMRESFSLDLFLLQRVAVLMDAFTSVFTRQAPFHRALYDSFARGSYLELDYQQEAANQRLFREELGRLKVPVVIPKVYDDLTTEKVLTTQWIDGIKLADAPQEQIKRLIPVGIELFLTQLLDIGRFHSDPHPGNLLVTKDGKLSLIDFGLCTQIDDDARLALTNAIVHLLMKDFDTLVDDDAKELGFLPENFDTQDIKPLIVKILTVGVVEAKSDLHHRRRSLLQISNELNEVFFRYPFSVPPFFALVTRGLALLEGIALSGDPNFDLFRASAPYARRRAVALLGRATFNRRMKSSERRVTASHAARSKAGTTKA